MNCLKEKMAKKQEDEKEQNSADTWLLKWSNPKEEFIEEDIKSNLSMIKSEPGECEEMMEEETKPNLSMIESEPEECEKMIDVHESYQENSQSSKNALSTATNSKSELLYSASCNNSETIAQKQKRNVHEETSLPANEETYFALKQKDFKDAPVSDTIANLCEYECPQCFKVYTAKSSLNYHLGTKHAYIGKSTSASHFQYMKKIVLHQCHICTKKILCTKFCVKSHIKKCHQMVSWESYCEMSNIKSGTQKQESEVNNLVGNLFKFTCKTCQFSCNSWHVMTKHMNGNSHGPVKKPNQHTSTPFLHQCHVCHELVLSDTRLILNHLAKHKMLISKVQFTSSN